MDRQGALQRSHDREGAQSSTERAFCLPHHFLATRATVSRSESTPKQNHWPRVVDPDLAKHKVNGEADPKCDAEEFVWTELPRREECAYDGPDGSDRQSDGKRANHPLAMKSDPSVTNEYKRPN